MRSRLFAVVMGLVGATAIGCGSSGGGAGDGGTNPPPALSIQAFDVVESGWGDAPLVVHFKWQVQSAGAAPLTCKFDFDGDGVFDKTIAGCNANTIADAPAGLPAYTFATAGEFSPKLSVSDGQASVQATTTVFANQLSFADKVIFPEQAAGFMNAAVLSATSVALSFDDPAHVPAIAAGTILWGTSAGGYLLTVAHASTTDAVVLVDGTPAAIQDAISDGFFGARDVAPNFDDATCIGSSDCSGLSFKTVNVAQAGVRQGALNLFSSAGLKITLPKDAAVKNELIAQVGVSRFVIAVHAHALASAAIVMAPSIRYALTMAAPTADWRWPSVGAPGIRMGVVSVGPFVILPVLFPVLAVQAAVVANFQVDAVLPLAITYDMGTWSSSLRPTVTPSAQLVTAGLAPSDALAASAHLRLEARLFNQGGPYVDPTVNLALAATGTTSSPCSLDSQAMSGDFCYTGSLGLAVNYGATIPWFNPAPAESAGLDGALAPSVQTFFHSCDADGGAQTCGDGGVVPDGGPIGPDGGVDAAGDSPSSANPDGNTALAISGAIMPGEQDVYTFDAEMGYGVVVRVADTGQTAFTPRFTVYDPAGKQVATASAADVAGAAFQAASKGTFTIVIVDGVAAAASVGGSYRLSVAVAPGANSDGALSAGGVVSGHIDEGALDSYTFSANMGEGLALRVTDVAGGALVPGIVLYDPTGARLAQASGADVTGAALSAPSTGTFTVIVYDASTGFAATGDYKLYFTKAPGAAKSGAVSSGVAVSGHIDKGALDSYAFVAPAGGKIALTVTETPAGPLVPGFSLYGPTGQRVAFTTGETVATATVTAAAAGTYTVFVYDASATLASTGDYTLLLTLTPGP